MVSKGYVPSLLQIVKSRVAKRNFVFDFYCAGKKTLDVGCGEGEFLKYDKNNIYGIDPNERVIKSLVSEGYHAVVGSAAHMPFGEGEFEVVHCHNMIEHVEIDVAYALLVESARVLKKGGHVVLSSEVVTKKFWDTFGHIKPYPPSAILKLLRKESREEFEGIDSLEPAGLFYIGDYHRNKILYLSMFCIGYLMPLFRREYFLILKKK